MAGPGKRGPAIKLTPRVHKLIVDAVSAGAFFSTACAHAGVPVGTGWEWIQRGKGEHPTRRKTPETADFAEAIARANADAELRAQTQLVIAGRTDWRANLAFLERRFPDRWGLRRYEITRAPNDEWEGPPPAGEPPTPERVAAILEVLAEAGVIVPDEDPDDDPEEPSDP